MMPMGIIGAVLGSTTREVSDCIKEGRPYRRIVPPREPEKEEPDFGFWWGFIFGSFL